MREKRKKEVIITAERDDMRGLWRQGRMAPRCGMGKAWFKPQERPSRCNRPSATSTQTPQVSADMN